MTNEMKLRANKLIDKYQMSMYALENYTEIYHDQMYYDYTGYKASLLNDDLTDNCLDVLQQRVKAVEKLYKAFENLEENTEVIYC